MKESLATGRNRMKPPKLDRMSDDAKFILGFG